MKPKNPAIHTFKAYVYIDEDHPADEMPRFLFKSKRQLIDDNTGHIGRWALHPEDRGVIANAVITIIVPPSE